MDLIKKKRTDFINRLSLKRKWKCGDMNPFFDEINTFMPKVKAKTFREYKKQIKIERKKHEKMAMFNYIRTSLCV